MNYTLGQKVLIEATFADEQDSPLGNVRLNVKRTGFLAQQIFVDPSTIRPLEPAHMKNYETGQEVIIRGRIKHLTGHEDFPYTVQCATAQIAFAEADLEPARDERGRPRFHVKVFHAVDELEEWQSKLSDDAEIVTVAAVPCEQSFAFQEYVAITAVWKTFTDTDRKEDA